MVNDNTHHQRNKVYHYEGGKEEAKEYYENNKEKLQKQLEIDIDNYLMKKKI